MMLGLAMFFGSFAHAIPILAIAGSMAAKNKVSQSTGTLPPDAPLFIPFLVSVIIFIALLQYLPAIALGPVAEHFSSSAERCFKGEFGAN